MTHDLLAQLDRALREWPQGPCCVLVSGGLDSTVLLHATASLPAARARGLRALHVDHNLHPNSNIWAQRVQACARALEVPLTVVRVDVTDVRGQGLEAAARRARYAALRQHLSAGETALTAHHADDQAETVLLRLMRGASIAGLGAMRPWRRFGPGYLARPLLNLPRQRLRGYADAHRLTWIDDPANRDTRHARTQLRERVLPALRERWPDAASRIARSAELLRGAATRLARDTAARLAALRGVDPACLDAQGLRALDASTRADVLRAWYVDLGLAPPDARALGQLERTVLDARPDATVLLRWPGGVLRRYRNTLYAESEHGVRPTRWPAQWDGRDILHADDGATLRFEPQVSGNWRVSVRAGGERMRMADARPTQCVKHLLQELGIPPWLRARAPFLWQGDELWAVGDWLQSQPCRAWQIAHGTRLIYAPRLTAPRGLG
jgi:tRNA(Ile)-lysidine synthase